MKTNNLIRVRLVNVDTIGASAGYGEGRTLEEAQDDGLARAERATVIGAPQPWFETDREICFHGGINC